MAKKVDLKSALAKARKSWNSKTKQKAMESRGGSEFEDGRYLMRLVGVSVGMSESGGRLQATTKWKILDGDYKGKTYRAYQGLENEIGQEIFGKDLQRLGFEIDEFDFTEKEFAALDKEVKKEKPIARVSLKSNGDFQNLRINQLLDEDDLEEDDDEDDEEDDDKPKKSKGKKSSKKSKDEDDEDENSDDDEDSDEEEDEDSDDDDEESDDDEDDEPKKSKGKKKSASKKSKGKKSKSDDEDDDEDDDEEDDNEDEDDDGDDEDEEEPVAVVVGSIVKIKTKDGVKKGEVTDIDEDDNKLSVKIDGKVKKGLSADKIISVEEPPAKAKKGKSKK